MLAATGAVAAVVLPQKRHRRFAVGMRKGCGMVAESVASTFGAAFGALVKRKRRVQGLTQLQLAEDAFGTGAKVRRISEIENGLVADPQPRTIDPLIVALGITEEELDACAASAPWQPDPELELAYRHARALLEAAAARFDLGDRTPRSPRSRTTCVRRRSSGTGCAAGSRRSTLWMSA